ncbi:MAG: hypothetical protein AVDCRST_MAG01-01-2077, partial [uncultured Rubrobacteraceae bacterium]
GQDQGRVQAARGEDPGGPAGRPPDYPPVRGRSRARPRRSRPRDQGAHGGHNGRLLAARRLQPGPGGQPRAGGGGRRDLPRALGRGIGAKRGAARRARGGGQEEVRHRPPRVARPPGRPARAGRQPGARRQAVPGLQPPRRGGASGAGAVAQELPVPV